RRLQHIADQDPVRHAARRHDARQYAGGGAGDPAALPQSPAAGEDTGGGGMRLRASRPATTRAQWLLWGRLTVAGPGGILAVITLISPFTWARVPLTHYPWALSLRMQWTPAVGVMAMLSPLLALAALLVRFWRAAALWLIAICAALQFAYVGLEAYWSKQERA